MVSFRETPETAAELIRLAMTTGRDQRHSGTPHVSDVIYCLRKAYFRRQGVVGRPLGTDDLTVFLSGEGLHQAIQKATGSELDGLVILQDHEVWSPEIPIQAHLDIAFADRDQVIQIAGEIKSTRVSSGKTPYAESFGHYIEQLASYCVVTGTQKGLLFVLHLLGDYRQAKQPIMRAWEFTWDRGELASWREEMARRSRLILSGNDPGPVNTHMSWECERCPYNQVCEGSKHNGRMVSWFDVEDDGGFKP